MTCTTQKVKEISGWGKIFPNEQSTANQSLQFVKKLVALSISQITYLRGIFPEKAYGDRKLDDIHLKILSDGSKCDGAIQIIKWVRACFDALEKKYLRQLILAIYTNPDEPDQAIESYNFRFAYTTNGTKITCNDESIFPFQSNSKNPERSKKSTLILLRTLIMLTQSLSPLPDNIYLAIKLLYYDEVTPKDYEPPGFKPCDTTDFLFKDEITNIRVGEVDTPHHLLKLKVKTGKRQFTDDNDIPSQKSIDKAQLAITSKEIEHNEMETENINIDNNKDDVVHMETEFKDADLKIVSCMCGNEKEQELMIKCCKCKKYQHAHCWSYFLESQLSQDHLCYKCGKEYDLPDEPYSLSPNEIKELFQMRQAVLFCKDNIIFTQTQMKVNLNLAKEDIQLILFYLEDEDIITTGKVENRGKKIVNNLLLQNRGFPKYFDMLKYNEFTNGKEEASEIERENISSVRDFNNEVENAINEIINDAKDINMEETKKLIPKRTLSSNKNDNRFEISSSQESNPGPARKKRKASILSEALLV